MLLDPSCLQTSKLILLFGNIHIDSTFNVITEIQKHLLHMSWTQYNKKSILLDRKEGAGILYLLDSSPILPPLYSCHLGALNCPLIQCHALSIYPLQQLSRIILSIAPIPIIMYQHQFQGYFIFKSWSFFVAQKQGEGKSFCIYLATVCRSFIGKWKIYPRKIHFLAISIFYACLAALCLLVCTPGTLLGISD